MNWFDKRRQEELKMIMKEDYNLEMSDEEVEEFGKDLVETFNLLLDADRGQKFEQRPSRFIDQRGRGKI